MKDALKNLQLYSVGLMIVEIIVVATFSVIENTIAVIVMVHMATETTEGIMLGQITESTHIEIIRGKVEGMIIIGKSYPPYKKSVYFGDHLDR